MFRSWLDPTTPTLATSTKSRRSLTPIHSLLPHPFLTPCGLDAPWAAQVYSIDPTFIDPAAQPAAQPAPLGQEGETQAGREGGGEGGSEGGRQGRRKGGRSKGGSRERKARSSEERNEGRRSPSKGRNREERDILRAAKRVRLALELLRMPTRGLQPASGSWSGLGSGFRLALSLAGRAPNWPLCTQSLIRAS